MMKFSIAGTSIKIGVFAVIAVGFSIVIWIFMKTFHLKNQEVTSWKTRMEADCALVLTGGPGRIKMGFDLLQRGDVRKLVISGVNPKVSLEDIFSQIDTYTSVQKFNVIIENHSATTYGNMKQSLPLLNRLRCQKTLLVTSYVHMPRAYRLFEKNAGELTFVPYSIYSRHKFSGFLYEALKAVFYEIWF